MIFIVVKSETRPDWTRRWPGLVERFTAATRAEPGNLWFDSARRLDGFPTSRRRWAKTRKTGCVAIRVAIHRA